MNCIAKLQKSVEEVTGYAPLLLGEAQSELKQKGDELLTEIQESQYIKVPLVGTFSAGKSSLLNVFTQKPGMLPVDTAPETAVAYELYYSPTECVELYREGQKIDEKPLSEIKSLQTKPGDIAKVYCKSEPVKNLNERGIVLVDMPGIGSGIEKHDAAIFNYIHSGTAFVLLVDVEQGSLRSSTLTFMEELSQYNLHPAIIVSKIDKKPESEVKEIVDYIEYQVKKLGDTQPYISTICSIRNELDGLNQYLSTLDAGTLLVEKISKRLKSIIRLVVEQMKMRIELRTHDMENATEKLQQLETEIANVKAELPANHSNADSPEKSTQDILDNVQAALTSKAFDIAQMIIDKEPEESIKAVIVSTVRKEIIISLKEESEQYSSALGSSVQESVSKLAAIEVNVDFINDFNEMIASLMPLLETLLNAAGVWGKIAQVLLPFLPSVINWLFGKSDAEVLDEVRTKVINKCVAPIAEELRPTIYKMIVENQKRIQEKIQTELVAKMEQMKESIHEKMADANKSKDEISKELEQLQVAVSNLHSMLETI